jgi:hypothetical protein
MSTHNLDPLLATMASTRISPLPLPAPSANPFHSSPPPTSEATPPRSTQSVEVKLLNEIKRQLSVTPASPDYATLRAAAVRERSEVNVDNSPEEALRREVNALRAGRTRYSIALKQLVGSFQRIRRMSVRITVMNDRVARMRLDVVHIKKARSAALSSKRQARQAKARAVVERVNMVNVRAGFGEVEEVRKGVRGLHFDETKEQARPSFRDEEDDLAMTSGEELGGTSQDERDAVEDEGIEEETEEDRTFTTPHASDEARLR